MTRTWTLEEAHELFTLPFFDLIHRAHAAHSNPNHIQISTLLSIKTGGCSEDCKYCSQSKYYKTGVEAEPMMSLEEVLERAKQAKAAGADRFCMGASGRGPKASELEKVCEMIREIKALGLETCVTLGLLQEHQAHKLKEAGLDFYNHNIDTSPEYYQNVIQTRTFDDRLQTLENVRAAGLKICCGGILGMGESNEDRIRMLILLANLPQPPESVPINHLIPVPGTPMENAKPVDPFDFVRTIALARIMMPQAYIRLSAGRETMSDELQALCFYAGANSVFYGEKLLTERNAAPQRDDLLFQRLGLQTLAA